MIEEIIKIIGSYAIITLLGGLLFSLCLNMLFGEYNIKKHPISGLGSSDTTRYYKIFNYLFMVLPPLFLCFYVTAHESCLYYYKYDLLIHAGFVGFYISSIAMFFIGYYPTDKQHRKHNLSASIVFSALFIGINFMGIAILVEKGDYILLISESIIMSVFVLFLGVKRTPLLEWGFFGVIIAIGIPFTINILFDIVSNM